MARPKQADAPSKSTSGKKHLDAKTKKPHNKSLSSVKLVSGKKSLEKPKKQKTTTTTAATTASSSSKFMDPSGNGVARATPRKRRGLQALKRCIQMQQSTSSMVRDAPFRRSLNDRLIAMELKVLRDTPYLHWNAVDQSTNNNNTGALGFNKSVGAIAGLMAVLGKKATDLLRCAASYASAAGRHAVTDTDVLRAAMQDEDLCTMIETNEVLRRVLDQRNVDGERTRRLQREKPFVGVKAHIYHSLKGSVSGEESEGDESN